MEKTYIFCDMNDPSHIYDVVSLGEGEDINLHDHVKTVIDKNRINVNYKNAANNLKNFATYNTFISYIEHRLKSMLKTIGEFKNGDIENKSLIDEFENLQDNLIDLDNRVLLSENISGIKKQAICELVEEIGLNLCEIIMILKNDNIEEDKNDE